MEHRVTALEIKVETMQKQVADQVATNTTMQKQFAEHYRVDEDMHKHANIALMQMEARISSVANEMTAGLKENTTLTRTVQSELKSYRDESRPVVEIGNAALKGARMIGRFGDFCSWVGRKLFWVAKIAIVLAACWGAAQAYWRGEALKQIAVDFLLKLGH